MTSLLAAEDGAHTFFGEYLGVNSMQDSELDGMAAGPPASVYHECASLLVIAFCEYDQVVTQTSASDVMLWLHDLHVELDTLCSSCPVTKMHSSGGEYVVAAYNTPELSGVEVLFAFARAAMLVTSQRLTPVGTPVRLSCGLHSGPLAAGIIGMLSLSYSVFGDTADITELLQRTCPPGALQMSSTAYGNLAQALPCKSIARQEHRKRVLNTYVFSVCDMLSQVEYITPLMGKCYRSDEQARESDAVDWPVGLVGAEATWQLTYRNPLLEDSYRRDVTNSPNMVKVFVLCVVAVLLLAVQAAWSCWGRPPGWGGVVMLQAESAAVVLCLPLLAAVAPREFMWNYQPLMCMAVLVTSTTNMHFCWRTVASLAAPDQRIAALLLLHVLLLNVLPVVAQLTVSWHLALSAVLAPLTLSMMVPYLVAGGITFRDAAAEACPYVIIGVFMPCFLSYCLEMNRRSLWLEARSLGLSASQQQEGRYNS